MDTKQTALGYYGAQLQRLASELQGLGYTMSGAHNDLMFPTSRGPSSSDLMSTAGTAARLKTQIDHVLDQLRQICLAGEAATPGDLKQ